MQANIQYPFMPKGHEIEMRTIAGLIHIGNPNDIRVQACMLKLDKDCFADIDHRVLFDLIQNLFKKGNSFDFVEFMTLVPTEQYHLVAESVKDEYISTNHLEYDVDKLLAYRALRNQVKILINAANSGLNEITPEQALIAISDNLQAINSSTLSGNKPYKRTGEQILDEIFTNGLIAGKDFLVDVPDLPPVPNEAMITIAGRSGHGKTFFALYLMDKIIDKFTDKQALYFNLEMRDHILLERLSILNGCKGVDQMDTLKRGASKILSKNLTVVTKAQITIEEIETESRLSAMQQPISVIVVDYLGLIRSKSKHESNHLQQSDIAKRLASLATDLKCVVLCLIQVNRDIKNRPVSDRCPIPTDSAESMGSVDSSSWWLGINQPQNDCDDDDFRDRFDIECRKSRTDSGLFKLRLKFKNGMFWKWEKPFCSKRIVDDGF